MIAEYDTIIKLWYFKKGEFVKEVELPSEVELKQRFSLVRYVPSDEGGLKMARWVFVRTGDRDYEYSHIEDVGSIKVQNG